MRILFIDAFKGASGKLCEHSDMGTTYNARTGKTYSHKLCNKRDLETFPYNEKEISLQTAFKKRTIVVCQTCKSLTDEQRKSLLKVRNMRGLFSIRQLIDGIYDKETETVPASALADLVAQAQRGSQTTSGGSTTPTGGTTPSGGGGSNTPSGNVTLTLTAQGGGKVQIGDESPSASASKSVAPGTQLTIKATANPGYGFDRWSDGQGGATRTITVNADTSLTASFISGDDGE